MPSQLPLLTVACSFQNYVTACIYNPKNHQANDSYLLQLLLLTVAVLLDNTVELLCFQASHVSLGSHPGCLLGGPCLSQVPVGGCHTLPGSLLLLPPLTLIGFCVPMSR